MKGSAMEFDIKGPVTAERLLAAARKAGVLREDAPPAAVQPGREPDIKDELLTPAEVATYYRVDPKTVTRWAKAGKLSSIRTLGGHRRYRKSEVLGLMRAGDRAA